MNRQNLQQQLEEQLKNRQNIASQNGGEGFDISHLQTEGIIEGMNLNDSGLLKLNIPGINSGRVNNCGNTYLDLSLTVNNINSTGPANPVNMANDNNQS
jgi:hypothetical protein